MGEDLVDEYAYIKEDSRGMFAGKTMRYVYWNDHSEHWSSNSFASRNRTEDGDFELIPVTELDLAYGAVDDNSKSMKKHKAWELLDIFLTEENQLNCRSMVWKNEKIATFELPVIGYLLSSSATRKAATIASWLFWKGKHWDPNVVYYLSNILQPSVKSLKPLYLVSQYPTNFSGPAEIVPLQCHATWGSRRPRRITGNAAVPTYQWKSYTSMEYANSYGALLRKNSVEVSLKFNKPSYVTHVGVRGELPAVERFPQCLGQLQKKKIQFIRFKRRKWNASKKKRSKQFILVTTKSPSMHAFTTAYRLSYREVSTGRWVDVSAEFPGNTLDDFGQESVVDLKKLNATNSSLGLYCRELKFTALNWNVAPVLCATAYGIEHANDCSTTAERESEEDDEQKTPQTVTYTVRMPAKTQRHLVPEFQSHSYRYQNYLVRADPASAKAQARFRRDMMKDCNDTVT